MFPFKLRYIKFPEGANSCVFGVTDYDEKRDRYTIYINEEMCEKRQLHTLKHELSHLKFNHLFDLTKGIEEVEAEADYYANIMTDEEFSELMQYQIKA